MNNARHKMSSVERRMNYVVVFMFAVTLTCSFIVASMAQWFNLSTSGKNAWYLAIPEPRWFGISKYGITVNLTHALSFVADFITTMVLGSTFIPISCIVTFECSKIFSGVMIAFDIEMVGIGYDERGDPISM